jgi:hypothetical protein
MSRQFPSLPNHPFIAPKLRNFLWKNGLKGVFGALMNFTLRTRGDRWFLIIDL